MNVANARNVRPFDWCAPGVVMSSGGNRQTDEIGGEVGAMKNAENAKDGLDPCDALPAFPRGLGQAPQPYASL